MGAKINGIHTKTGYGLDLLAIEIGIPEPARKKQQVPGRNFFYTEGVEGIFEQRTIKLKFDHMDNYSQWIQKIDELSAVVNGKEVKLELDNAPGYFYCGIATVSAKKNNGVFSEFTITILAEPFKTQGTYETVTFNAATSKVVSVKGHYETPCIVEITPTFDISSITLTGIARNPVTKAGEKVIIKNLKNGQKVILDGEAGTVTQGGQNKFADTEMWEFPSLVPGNNTITCSSNQCNITIKYKPRFI